MEQWAGRLFTKMKKPIEYIEPVINYVIELDEKGYLKYIIFGMIVLTIYMLLR